MAIKVYNPTTAARRGMTTRDLAAITKKRPAKSLTRAKNTITGRNNQGKITVRHRGGGQKRFYRLVSFSNLPDEVTVAAIEFDPNRSAYIAHVKDPGGKPYYVLAASDMKVGQTLLTGKKVEIKSGNRLALKNIPLGMPIYNVELAPNRGGQVARSAGNRAQIAAKDKGYAQVRLPSGEIRLISLECFATIGGVGNEAHQHIKWGSAGRRRRLGFRPSVHGKAMNPADHPLGGGEGKTGPGRLPRTPWGKIAIGAKTRRRKSTAKLIVRSRHASRRSR